MPCLITSIQLATSLPSLFWLPPNKQIKSQGRAALFRAFTSALTFFSRELPSPLWKGWPVFFPMGCVFGSSSGGIGPSADPQPGRPPRMAARMDSGAGRWLKRSWRLPDKFPPPGDIRLFYTTADNFFDPTPPELCKKSYVEPRI